MRRLVLLRHGEAETPTLAVGDFDRGLTPRGRADARAAGAWLAGRGIAVDLALVSPALRAGQTWEEASAALGQVACERPDSLYDGNPRAMLALAESAPVETVMIVAHNPGLHILAARLAEAAPCAPPVRAAVRRGLAPAALAVFVRDQAGRLAGEAFHAPEAAGA